MFCTIWIGQILANINRYWNAFRYYITKHLDPKHSTRETSYHMLLAPKAPSKNNQNLYQIMNGSFAA